MMKDGLHLGFSKKLESVEGAYIHPTAHVAPGAELGKDVHIGPNAVIGAHVKLGDRVRIGVGVIVEGRVQIGADTEVYPYATIGSDPQDLKYRGEDTSVEIGERNRIREYVNVSLGTEGGGGVTRIGNDNLIMVYCHVGHDCIVGDHCIFANGVQLAGHVEMGSYVVFGGLSGAHQFSRYGDFVMVAAGSMCSQDVPPFCMVHGDHARINGLNLVGIRRSEHKNLSDIKAMYRLLYHENLTMDEAIARAQSEVPESAARDIFVDFLRKTKRGVCR